MDCNIDLDALQCFHRTDWPHYSEVTRLHLPHWPYSVENSKLALGSIPMAHGNLKAAVNLREQQGVSVGHLFPGPHVGGLSAITKVEAANAARTASLMNRTIVRFSRFVIRVWDD